MYLCVDATRKGSVIIHFALVLSCNKYIHVFYCIIIGSHVWLCFGINKMSHWIFFVPSHLGYPKLPICLKANAVNTTLIEDQKRQLWRRSRAEGIIQSEPQLFGVPACLEMIPLRVQITHTVVTCFTVIETFDIVCLIPRWLNVLGILQESLVRPTSANVQSSVSQTIERLYCDSKMRLCSEYWRAQSRHQTIFVDMQVWMPTTALPAGITGSFG